MPVLFAIFSLLGLNCQVIMIRNVCRFALQMGNMETLGKIGSKTIKVILLYMTVVGAFMAAFASLFYHIEKGDGNASSFSQILDLIYDIIPTNLFEPFVTGNALQLIFISVIVGLAMLVLSSKVSGVFSLVEQLSSIVQTMMSGLCSMLPILIFVIFAGMISNGNLAIILRSWKIIVVIVLMIAVYYAMNLLRISFAKKISPALLFKKAWPTLLISLTTASSAAAFATNTRDANAKLGIDKKLVEFGIPIGQVLFKPGFFALLFGVGIGLAESCNITITLPWLLISFLTILLVNFAVPPIPGGAMLGFTIVFAQLGIPMEAMGIAIAINAIADFPATAGNVSGWQLTLIDVADSVVMCVENHSKKVNMINCTLGNNSPVDNESEIQVKTQNTLTMTDCTLGDTTFENKGMVDGVGSIFGEGSLSMIVALLALMSSAVSIFFTVYYNKKKTVPVAANNATEANEE